jgi:hypothetical protein
VQYRQFSELREGLAKLIAQHLPVAAETLDNPLEPLQKKVLQLFKGPSARLSRSEIATAVGVSPDMARLIAETMLDTHLERTGSRGGARYARIKKVGRPRKFQPTRSRRKSKK